MLSASSLHFWSVFFVLFGTPGSLVFSQPVSVFEIPQRCGHVIQSFLEGYKRCHYFTLQTESAKTNFIIVLLGSPAVYSCPIFSTFLHSMWFQQTPKNARSTKRVCSHVKTARIIMYAENLTAWWMPVLQNGRV